MLRPSRPAERRLLAFTIMSGVFTAAMILVAMTSCAKAHDATRPELDAWYSQLKMPDRPDISCCGDSDSYWCDDLHVQGEHSFCTITDDRDDAPLRRAHVDVGTVIEIPSYKFDRGEQGLGNPTGHSIVFLRLIMTGEPYVYCFVLGALI